MKSPLYVLILGTAVAQWIRRCATNRKVAGSIPAGVNRFFIDIKSFRSHYGPGVDPACNRSEYREYFLGVKIGRCVRLTTLPPSCAVVTKSGSLNFLEPSGPALPFYVLILPRPSCVCSNSTVSSCYGYMFWPTDSHNQTCALHRITKWYVC